MLSADEWYANPRFVDFGSNPIFMRRDGSGDPVLFLHGFPTTSWDWYKVWPQLTAKYQCTAFDFLGFGYSSRPPGHEYSIHEQADVSEAVIKANGLKRFKLIAHDYGVTVAQELMARQVDGSADYEIESVILFNGGLFPETHRARLIQKLLLGPLGPLLNRLAGSGRFSSSFSAVFGPNTQPSRYELEQFWRLLNYPKNARHSHKLMHYVRDRRTHRERWVGALKDYQGPLRLINGLLDPVSGAHLVERFREIIDPDADVVELPEIGHYPQVEDPESSLKGILNFKRGGYS